MGWQNCHMHHFVIDGERYGRQMSDDFDYGEETKDESKGIDCLKIIAR